MPHTIPCGTPRLNQHCCGKSLGHVASTVLRNGPFSTGNSGLASPDLVKMGTQRDASACLPTA